MRGEFFGIFVAQFIERERAPRGDFQGAVQRGGHAGEGGPQFLPRVQMTFRVRLPPVTRLGHRSSMAHGGQHVVQGPPPRHVVQHVAGGHQRDAAALRLDEQILQLPAIVRTAPQGDQQIAAVGEHLSELPQHVARRRLANTRRRNTQGWRTRVLHGWQAVNRRRTGAGRRRVVLGGTTVSGRDQSGQQALGVLSQIVKRQFALPFCLRGAVRA